MKKSKYSILINTTDSFEDCWIPFFTLFKKFWPDFKGEIYLNTETKEFNFPGLNIISVKNNSDFPNKKITWSECLIRALKTINSEIILYMQEDYFLKDNVKDDIVERYVKMMEEHSDIHCIHLTDQSVLAEKNPSIYEGLYPATLKQRYRISCQAALWRKEVLLSHLRTYENAWQFEEFGSKRSAIFKHNFFVVDHNWVKLNRFEIIPYVFTGIVQGRWYEEVIQLFKSQNIEVNYSNRGFVKDAKKRPFFKKIIRKTIQLPTVIKSYTDLALLKLSN